MSDRSEEPGRRAHKGFGRGTCIKRNGRIYVCVRDRKWTGYQNPVVGFEHTTATTGRRSEESSEIQIASANDIHDCSLPGQFFWRGTGLRVGGACRRWIGEDKGEELYVAGFDLDSVAAVTGRDGRAS